MNNWPDMGSFEANCLEFERYIKEAGCLYIHIWNKDNDYTVCGIPVEVPNMVATTGIYFMWGILNEKMPHPCRNCEERLSRQVMNDLLTQLKAEDEKSRGLDPWALPPIYKNEEGE